MATRVVSEPKGFQLATANRALEALRSTKGSRRFLIADEVGLGKTVVARTIIQKMMKRRSSPLVVFYVASNLNIAHQNRTKLLEFLQEKDERDDAMATADRLTLTATAAKRATHPKIRLYTLTPETSVPLYRRRGGLGKLEERVLIYCLLTRRIPSLSRSPDFQALCKGPSRNRELWDYLRRTTSANLNLRGLSGKFLANLVRDPAFERLGKRIDQSWFERAMSEIKRSRLMGSLRSAAALTMFHVLRPNLIIFDEFQKFRELLIDDEVSPARKAPMTDSLTKAMRGGFGRRGPSLLLLSATPYPPYSSRLDDRRGDSHHDQFFRLIRFLYGEGSSEPDKVSEALTEFGRRVQSQQDGVDWKLISLFRDRIEKGLRPVMSRTERRDLAGDLPSHDHGQPKSSLLRADLRVFKHWVARLRASGDPNLQAKVDLMSFAVPLWTSVPLPVQMLGKGYLAWRRAKRDFRASEPKLTMEARDDLKGPANWPHPQLRALKEIVPKQCLALPWVAPSFPWWDLAGPWAEPDAKKGKLLLFSRFKAVPPAIASLLSFDLETEFASGLDRSYEKAGRRRPLQFKSSRTKLAALFLPSPKLAAYTDPFADGVQGLIQIRKSMRRQVRSLLRNKLGVRIEKKGPKRSLWRLLAALEARHDVSEPEAELANSEEISNAWARLPKSGRSMRGALVTWRRAAEGGLETITEAEVGMLARLALESPGIVLARVMWRFDRTCLRGNAFKDLLQASWDGLRQYLNRALFHAVLTKGRIKRTYPDAIAAAVVDGNLESVLDEHLWITSKLDADAIQKFPSELKRVFGLREGRHSVHEPGKGRSHFPLRSHAAMPFANAKINKRGGGEERLRTDDLRRAFNSPFLPHVLATTSTGQEGLDFHVWCGRLLHWDLCGNPLDLEQREGRIQRFGGLSIRQATAERLKDLILGRLDLGASPWVSLAVQAETEAKDDLSGLRPWWSCHGERLDRLFVSLPQSREVARFAKLSRERWIYRLALGQPHQQDFVEKVSRHAPDKLKDYTLRLSAWQERPPLVAHNIAGSETCV